MQDQMDDLVWENRDLEEGGDVRGGGRIDAQQRVAPCLAGLRRAAARPELLPPRRAHLAHAAGHCTVARRRFDFRSSAMFSCVCVYYLLCTVVY
jgi:hypothetical protein